MSLTTLLAGAERAAGRLAVEMPANWMQGRTVYGGLSVGLAYEAARTCAEGMGPLRSLQVAFVGPLAGRIEASAEVLRRGRSASFVQADVRSGAGLGLRATFLFSASRESSLSFEDAPAPEGPALDHAVPARQLTPVNFFTHHFEYRHALAKTAEPAPELRRWVRLVEREGLDPMTGLLTLADALPPAAMAVMAAPGPISSATWMMNLLSPEPATRDGWWLLQARGEQAKDGVSSQSMAIWNSEGRPIATGMQSVAIFV